MSYHHGNEVCKYIYTNKLLMWARECVESMGDLRHAWTVRVTTINDIYM